MVIRLPVKYKSRFQKW